MTYIEELLETILFYIYQTQDGISNKKILKIYITINFYHIDTLRRMFEQVTDKVMYHLDTPEIYNFHMVAIFDNYLFAIGKDISFNKFLSESE